MAGYLALTLSSTLAVRDFKDPKDPFLMIVSVIRFRERMVMK